MKFSFKFFATTIAISCLLTGCIGNNFEKEAQRVKEQKEELKKETTAKENKKSKEQAALYKSLEKPLDKVILENDLDSVKEMDSIQVESKTHYDNASELARYAGQVLYGFYTGQVSPKEYYKFLLGYGSEDVKNELPSKDDALVILSTLSDTYKNANITGEGYDLTEVTYDRLKRSGTFYRKVLTTNGEEYFITTITLEDGKWKYVEDSPSPPYEIEQ
ncbi:hypothetical protein [Mesobacillus zeae]|uniref:hypothetical protein n=1 Tax=Mesobacillus zeae TaxID=1917180 RepID=UPI003008219E